ncbi:transporter substrate-binding domain-containing protein [Streptomyces sp. NPDC005925]|uniref:transporter substrate-binding domain-containing protein n=1 Tax=Streptomyces sp. NPDC005925 TaxID=3157172 RepID=UPI0033C40EF3
MGLSGGLSLERIRCRGKIRVGTSLGFHGLSLYDDKRSTWTGFDVDMARAVAVALLGDAEAIEFVPLTSAERFEALAEQRIDMGSYNASITYTREAEHGLTFIHPVLHDGEVFATRPENLRHGAGSDLSIREVKSARIGMLAGSTTAENVSRLCRRDNIDYTPVLYRTPQDALAGYLSGEASVYCLDSYLLAGELSSSGEIDNHVFLREQVSLEAMSPVARSADWDLVRAIRWALFAVIEADNLGLTQHSLPTAEEESATPYLRSFLRPSARTVEKLGLQPDFTSLILEKVGSYSDIFERNLGMSSALKQERKANHLRTQGGMLYAPLFI